MLGERPGYVVEAPVREIRLRAVLHLHDELLRLVGGLAQYVVHHRALPAAPAFFSLSRQRMSVIVPKPGSSLEKLVQEVHQEGLRLLPAEDALETKVGERIDILCHTQDCYNCEYSKYVTSRKTRLQEIFAAVYRM